MGIEVEPPPEGGGEFYMLTVRSQTVDENMIAFLGSVPGLRSLSFSQCRFESQGSIQALSELTELTRLNCRGSRFSELSLNILKRLDKLRLVDFTGCELTSQQIEFLTTCHDLEWLILNDNDRIGDDSILWDSAHPKLVSLSLRGTSVSSKLCTYITKSPELEILLLSKTLIDDAIMSTVGKLKKLKNVAIQGTRITDDGIANLVSCSRLTYLDCSGLRVTYAGIFRLVHCTELSIVHVDEDVATAEQMAEFDDIRLEARRQKMAREGRGR